MAKVKAKAAGNTSKKVNPLMADGVDRGGKPARWTHDDDNVGTTLLGRFVGQRVVTFDDGRKGMADIFSPAVVMDENGALTAHAKIETLHSAALESCIIVDVDKRSVFGIEYTGKSPARDEGHADFKTFAVVKKTAASLVKLLRECDAPELADLLASQA